MDGGWGGWHSGIPNVEAACVVTDPTIDKGVPLPRRDGVLKKLAEVLQLPSDRRLALQPAQALAAGRAAESALHAAAAR